MERFGVRKNSVLAVLMIVVFAASIFSQMPFVSSAISSNQKVVKIGVIAPDTFSTGVFKALFNQVVQPEINTYVSKLPKDRFTPNIRFEFQVVDAAESEATHLQLVKMFHKNGVDIIIGGFDSSQAASSLDYVNKNHMLLISPGSSAPSLAIAGDNLFRLFPDDNAQGKAIAAMLISKGVMHAVVIRSDNLWAADIFQVFKTEYINLGGQIGLEQTYSAVTTDFKSTLSAAETYANSHPVEGVLALSKNEIAPLITEAGNSKYPKIYSLLWFGADATAQDDALLTLPDGAPEEACQLKIFSTMPAATHSSKFNEMDKKLYGMFGFGIPFPVYTCIDAAWIAAMGVIETQHNVLPNVSATDVIKVLPDDCSRYFGYSGWCQLNAAGDRLMTNYEIWGYVKIDNTPNYGYVLYGTYDTLTGQATWLP